MLGLTSVLKKKVRFLFIQESCVFHTIECHLFAASEDTTVKKGIVWVVFF